MSHSRASLPVPLGCLSRSAAAVLTLLCTLATAQPPSSLGAAARAGTAVDGRGEYCSATTQLLRQSCEHEATDDNFRARALCINQPDTAKRVRCQADARQTLAQTQRQCDAQQVARAELCGSLGEQRYAPDFEPAHFDADFRHLTRANPYFPLAIGNSWRYAGGGEAIVVSVLDKTKLIQGVRCITFQDRVTEGGAVVENTFDWYAQRKDGTVYYCGEIARNYELFEGDQPFEPELIGVEGSWKTGRDGDLPGTQFLAEPQVGTVYRQEFSPGNAEDAATVLSISYGYGSDPELDRFVPAALARHLCAANDCVVTGEFTPITPTAYERKYYARGIGLFLEVDPAGGSAVRLLECNMDPRCAGLGAVATP